jgi:2-hydroxy-6-oxonona-2,4-dienedioate hydrolase
LRARFVGVGSVRTRYLTAGEPAHPPLLLVHGMGVTADMWFRNLDVLGERYWVIAPDLLGHGFTDVVTLTGAPQGQMLAHLMSFLDALGVGSCSMAGSSFGAAIACLAALEEPHRVQKVVIVSSGSVYNDIDYLRNSLKATRENGLSAMKEASISACRERLGRIQFRRTTVPEEVLLCQVTSYARDGAIEFYSQCLDNYASMLDAPGDERSRFFVRDRLATLATPALVIAGKNDPRANVDEAYRVQEIIPTCELAVFDECGHQPHVEQPERFNEVVRRFVG